MSASGSISCVVWVDSWTPWIGGGGLGQNGQRGRRGRGDEKEKAIGGKLVSRGGFPLVHIFLSLSLSLKNLYIKRPSTPSTHPPIPLDPFPLPFRDVHFYTYAGWNQEDRGGVFISTPRRTWGEKSRGPPPHFTCAHGAQVAGGFHLWPAATGDGDRRAGSAAFHLLLTRSRCALQAAKPNQKRTKACTNQTKPSQVVEDKGSRAYCADRL